MTVRIKKNDQVVVTTGKDKGARGRVLKVLVDRDRVIIEGVNRVKRHQKPARNAPQGGIIEREASIHISNVMLIDPKTDKPTRVRMGLAKDGRKARQAVSGAPLDG